ncbi:MAG TPA: FecR domain-containing protein [Steroidobacteraceae bacterium]|nr:FecR domain-containing protein [Steroidobacteraceae bacterium]
MTSSVDELKAADWFSQAHGADMDRALEESWLKWIQDPEHQRAYENCELAWEFSGELRDSPQLAALLAAADALVARGEVAAARRARRRLPLRQLALAASLIAVGVFAWLFLDRPEQMRYMTAVGEQRTVVLPDGSTVQLNTDSDIRVELSRHLRRIVLTRGEALFSVAHDPQRPFQVLALRGVTTAVGTQFDVEIVRSGAAVSVLEGTVTVGGARATAEPVAVSAGRGVGYSVQGTLSELRPAEISRIQGWRTQHIVFDDVPLETALAEYNRYRRKPIVLGDPALGSRHVNGVFHIGDEAAFLSAMEQGLHLKAIKGDTQTTLQAEPFNP